MAEGITKRIVEDTRVSGAAASRARGWDPRISEQGARELQSFLPRPEILSQHVFKRHLQLEKRRTDRSRAPLSFVLVRLESDRAGRDTINELLDLLCSSKRETDIIGSLAKDQVGLLLPHTDEPGARAYVASVAKKTAHLPVSITASTYPDCVFDNLTVDGPKIVSESLVCLVEEPLRRSRASSLVKRALDVVGALTAITLFSPFMLITALAVAVSSPGPVIFKQVRYGARGVPFVLYKFRSMRINTDDRIHREYVANLIEGNLEKINQGDKAQPLYKIKVDPRITPVGRFIRRTSLDELPQLFNVLKGDMSLVGPRPPLPYEADKYQSWHLRRVLETKPGITGLWQVEGRSTTSFDDMVRLDLRYVAQRSLWLDLKILLKTVRVLFGNRGAT